MLQGHYPTDNSTKKKKKKIQKLKLQRTLGHSEEFLVGIFFCFFFEKT